MRRHPILTGACILLFLIAAAWFWPLPKALLESSVSTVKILDRNGALLFDERAGGLRQDLPLSSIPSDIQNALIATEDRTFRTNAGISLRGMARAFLHDLQAGQIVEGGSGITQQYVRTMLQPAHRGVLYKIHEAWLALKLTARFSKDEILSRYLNNAFF